MTRALSFALAALTTTFLSVSVHAASERTADYDDEVLSDRPANSVRPKMTMAEQLQPCAQPHNDKAFVKINIKGLDNLEGNVRVQVYGSNPDDFLSKGKKLKRVDVALSDMLKDTAVCVDLPSAGAYAFVVMHDVDANGRANFLTEGFGFSNNPRLFLAPPDHEDVIVNVALGVSEMDVEMRYVSPSGKKNRDRHRRR